MVCAGCGREFHDFRRWAFLRLITHNDDSEGGQVINKSEVVCGNSRKCRIAILKMWLLEEEGRN